MSMLPYQPFRQLETMKREMDRFFSDFPMYGDQDGQRLGSVRIDVHETENEVIATCDIPGLEKKEDVHLEVENNRLTIKGTIHRTNEVKEENMHKRERYTGSFHRIVGLPSPVKEQGIKATYKNGVLEVRMPKVDDQTNRRIDVDFH